MKRIILTLILAQATTAAAWAQSGPTTQAMTCEQARGIVAARGAVVLRTGPSTYDRYVRDSSFCPHPQTARAASIRTADTAQCAVGGVCRETTVENGQ